MNNHSKVLKQTQKYFSWGDTIGKNKNGNGSYVFSSSNYYNGVCGSGHNLSGDIPQGNATYDAATANMRSPWNMPTTDQYQDLINGTTYTWTTLNGKNGMKFTSKKDSSKYIFLPAGGRYQSLELVNKNVVGSYWTTTYNSVSRAYYMSFNSTSTSMGASNRYGGDSVRAI